MSDAVQFETPENVQIAYRPAGLGTRFMAWTIDQVIVSILMFLIFLGVIFLAAAFEDLGDSIGGSLQFLDPYADGDFDPEDFGLFLIGLMFLLFGFGSFVYFGLSELLLRGQTLGKRSAKIRVVKADGFALDAPSVFLRNLFRVADQMPVLWAVPVFSPRSQRFGDMVSGTLVVEDGEAELPPLRAALANRTAADAQYRFDPTALSKARERDIEAIEGLLGRWADLGPEDQRAMTTAIVPPLAERLGVEPPEMDAIQKPRRFLEDLLAAEYRRRDRSL